MPDSESGHACGYLQYIDEKQAAEYLDEMDVRKAAAILSRMETDAVVDVLRMIPKKRELFARADG